MKSSRSNIARAYAAPQAPPVTARANRPHPGTRDRRSLPRLGSRPCRAHLAAESERQIMANYNPYDELPKVASFELTSEDVRDGEELDKAQLSGLFGAGGE